MMLQNDVKIAVQNISNDQRIDDNIFFFNYKMSEEEIIVMAQPQPTFRDDPIFNNLHTKFFDVMNGKITGEDFSEYAITLLENNCDDSVAEEDKENYKIIMKNVPKNSLWFIIEHQKIEEENIQDPSERLRILAEAMKE